MISRIQNALYSIGTIATGALVGVLLLHFGWHTAVHPSLHSSYVLVDGHSIAVSVARTPADRERGLSGTPSLATKTGKLFLFDTPMVPGFWMKDMAYPLDLVWIRPDWTVVAVTADVSPATYPQIFYPPEKVQYVLEINAGEALSDGIVPGALIKFEQ